MRNLVMIVQGRPSESASEKWNETRLAYASTDNLMGLVKQYQTNQLYIGVSSWPIIQLRKATLEGLFSVFRPTRFNEQE